MSNSVTEPLSSASRTPPAVVRVPPPLLEFAVARLVGQRFTDGKRAVRDFLAGSRKTGIDLSLMWATFDRDPGNEPKAREVCLLIPGGGRTGMLFVSSGPTSDAATLGDRVAVLRAAIDFAAVELPTRIRLAQTLPDPGDIDTRRALEAAGFRWIGDLLYLRRRLRGADRAIHVTWPEDVSVVPIRNLDRDSSERADLAVAMESSYEATLDCPKLCGLRETQDVIDSHRAAGKWQPGLWWIVYDLGQPAGCMLLNPSPEHDAVDLVYLGLASRLRGRGLGTRLLKMGIAAAAGVGPGLMTCAVDRRNVPALRMYERLGFSAWAERVAMVRQIGGASLENNARDVAGA